MKKHIFGFALFSFIVGTAFFINTMLNIVNIEEVKAPDYSPNYSRATTCWNMKRKSSRAGFGSPIVRQAIFNLESKQLKWELDTSGVETPIRLNFYIRGKKDARYINSMFVPMQAYRHGSVSATSSYEWLNNLDSYENLYVIAEPILSGEQIYKNLSNPMSFDAGKATPVLIY